MEEIPLHVKMTKTKTINSETLNVKEFHMKTANESQNMPNWIIKQFISHENCAQNKKISIHMQKSVEERIEKTEFQLNWNQLEKWAFASFSINLKQIYQAYLYTY